MSLRFPTASGNACIRTALNQLTCSNRSSLALVKRLLKLFRRFSVYSRAYAAVFTGLTREKFTKLQFYSSLLVTQVSHKSV